MAFREVRKAKIETVKTLKLIALFDFYFSLIKYYVSTFIKRNFKK